MFMPSPDHELSDSAKIQLLMDERDIRNVLARDCRAKARCDAELMAACYHDDAFIHQMPFFDGFARDVVPHMADQMRAAAEMMHYCYPQILIELDGDIARTESLNWSAKRFHDRAENGDVIMGIHGGRLIDRFERRNGQWRIVERWYHHEWGYFQQVPPMTTNIGPYGPHTEPQAEGVGPFSFSRDSNDLSYSVF